MENKNIDEFRPIGFLNYEVSKTGLVRSNNRFVYAGQNRDRIAKGRIIKPSLTNSGYEQVQLTSKFKRFYVHRLVASAFIRELKPKEEVNHKDGNKLNNRLENLEIVTSSENKKHSYKFLGNKSWNIKLTKRQAERIRELKRIGHTQKSLAQKYKVSPMVVSRLIRNQQACYQ